MDSTFSPHLSLTDLSDYLTPSQVCIKPVHTAKVQSHPTAELQVSLEDDASTLKKAEISLSDCLACSGCITSAESILVSMQSYEEVFRALQANPDLVPIVTISPQSLASLAAFHRITKKTALRGLRYFFKTVLGFRMVLDTTFAHSLVLDQASFEFQTTSSLSSETQKSDRPLPILSAACPGFVCFAEKTRSSADVLVPRLSRVKSPMAAMGWMVKEGWLASKLNISPDNIYHISVMMCFDKKLEASRSDFHISQQSMSASSGGGPPRQIDCVLTTGEVQKLMESHAFFLGNFTSQATGVLDEEDTILPSLPTRTGTSSGAFLYNAIQTFLFSLPPHRLLNIRLEVSHHRGAEDFQDYYLVEKDTVVFKGAKCYGFKNLQNMVRKVSKSTSSTLVPWKSGHRRTRTNASVCNNSVPPGGEEKDYDYIEVMACPSGCVNGGGQISRPKQERDMEGMAIVDNGKGWIEAVEQAYWDEPVPMDTEPGDLHHTILPYLVPKLETDQTRCLKRELLMNTDWLETSYRIVEDEEVNGLAVKW